MVVVREATVLRREEIGRRQCSLNIGCTKWRQEFPCLGTESVQLLADAEGNVSKDRDLLGGCDESIAIGVDPVRFWVCGIDGPFL